MSVVPVQQQSIIPGLAGGTAGTSLFTTPAPVLGSLAQFTGLQGGVVGGPVTSLDQLQRSLQGGIVPSLADLSALIPANLDPSSPEAQQLQARIAGVFTSNGGAGDLRLQQLLTQSSIRQLDSVTGALRTVGANLDPGSPEAQQLQARIAGIDSLRTTLQLQLNRQLSIDPSHGGQIQLPPVPAGTRIADGSALLATIQNSLQQGIVPSLDTLSGLQPSLDPSGPEAQQLNARVVALLSQGGAPGAERAKQYSITQSIKALDNTTGALMSVFSNLDPGSPESQQLKARLDAIKATRTGLQQQLDTSVGQDPSHGGAIGVNGQPVGTQQQQPPVQNLLVLMMQMMLQMMQLLFGGRR